MSSYTHGGYQQIARRVKDKTIDPNYTDEEIVEVLRLSQAFAMMAFIQIVLVAVRRDLEAAAIQRLYALELFKKQ
jgi:acetylglutamate kinase